MYTPSQEKFLEKARHGNLIPVWREVAADQDTPVSVYRKLRLGMNNEDAEQAMFLLESVEGGEHLARYSFVGFDPRAQFTAVGRNVWIDQKGEETRHMEHVDPLTALKEYMSRFNPVQDAALPRFTGGAVGYIGYDAVAQFERVPLPDHNDLKWPDMILLITDMLIIFDHVRQTMKLVANAYIEDDDP
ncbi:MAG: anthranilate synthase component I, partial [Verrucomicrobiota bacterium]